MRNKISTLTWRPAWQQDGVEIKKNSLIYHGAYELTQLQLRHRYFSGEWSPWLTREYIKRADAVAVLLWDAPTDQFILVEQFRVGPLFAASSASPWLLEVVAGLLEPNEEIEGALRRETEEEAGCAIHQLFKIGHCYNSPGGFAEKTFLFFGIIEALPITMIKGIEAEHEDIRVHVLPTTNVLEALEKGELLTSATTVIALQWFQLNKQRLYDAKNL